MGLHRVLIVVLLFTLSASQVSAKGKPLSDDDAEILDYIASHNAMVKTLEQTTKKTWAQYFKDSLQVTLKGSYSASPSGSSYSVGGSGGVGGTTVTTSDRGEGATTGIDITFPLYPFQDPREKREGIETIAKAREEVISKAIPLLTSLRQAQAKLMAVRAIHDAHKGNVEYLKKRVEAGVDYQKNFFSDYLAYLKVRNDLDDLTAQADSNMTSLLALVDFKNREELKGMLLKKRLEEEPVSEKEETPEPADTKGGDADMGVEGK